MLAKLYYILTMSLSVALWQLTGKTRKYRSAVSLKFPKKILLSPTVERFCIQHVANARELNRRMHPPKQLFYDSWRDTTYLEALGPPIAARMYNRPSGWGWSLFTMGDVVFKRSYWKSMLCGW